MNKEGHKFLGKIKNSAEKVAGVYYNPKPWESEKMYKALGVRRFQSVLKILPIYRHWEADKKDPAFQLYFGYFAETVHAAILPIATTALIQSIEARDPLYIGINAVSTFGANLYPILSQRYNRIRIRRVRELYKRREERLEKSHSENYANEEWM